jgi:hypothetical protein
MENLGKKPKLLPKGITNIPDFAVPACEEELDELIRRAKVKPINELDQGYLGSGSDVTQTQFASVRIVFPPTKYITCFRQAALRARYGLDTVWEVAVQLVQNSG